MVIIEPYFRKIPVLSLLKKVLQIALHLLIKPIEPTFVRQVTATGPLAVPMLVLFSFPVFVDFAARWQLLLHQRIPGQDFHFRPRDIRCLQCHR